jgi:hypothetical protein
MVHGLLSFVVAVTVAAVTLVGIEWLFASRLQSLYSSANPFAILITAIPIIGVFGAIPIIGALSIYIFLAETTAGKSRLAVAVPLSATAVAVLVLVIVRFLGPYGLAFSFGAMPAWIAGGVAGSISMVRAANAGVGEFSKLPKFTPAIVGGAVAGALPVIVLLIIHLS